MSIHEEAKIFNHNAKNGFNCLCPRDSYFLKDYGFLSYAQQNDKPDIIIPSDRNKIYAIEHFSFDSSHYKDGSQFRKEEDYSNKILSKNLKLDKDQEFKVSSSKIEYEGSIEDYIKNAINTFNDHYVKYNVYKNNLYEKNLIHSDSQIIFAFYIQDLSPFANFVEGKRGANLLLFKDFLDVIQDSYKLDCIFYSNETGGNNNMYFLKNEKESINYVRNNNDIISDKDIDFYCWQPNVIGYSVRIPH